MTEPGEPVLTRPSDVGRVLASFDLRPSKTLGQNFLTDANILAAIVEAARISPVDEVLEIGPGLGVLTEALAVRAKRVLAVEKDLRLAPHLHARFAETPNVELRFCDALDLDWAALARGSISRMVSNLPYSSGSAILAELFRQGAGPALAVVTLQLEVAQRMVANPGSRAFGLLSVWAQANHTPSIARVISPTCFYPTPDVRSAAVVLERRPGAYPAPEAMALFFKLTKRAFGQRRKQIKTIFSGRASNHAGGCDDGAIVGTLAGLGVDCALRPEALGAETWLALAVALQRGQIP